VGNAAVVQVVLLEEVDPGAVELLSPFVVERVGGRLRRPVARREHLPVLLGTGWAVRRDAVLELELEVVAEQLLNVLPATPVEGNARALGRRRLERFIIANIFPRPPSGSQLTSPSRPPLFVTRASSLAAASWSGANMTPQVEDTMSKLPSAMSSSRSQSPTR
jgi:hypothetical protein